MNFWVYCIFLYIKGAQNNKFDNKSEKCIFFGYSDVTKGYKLYNPEIRKLIVSRDFQFLEKESWTWTQTYSEEKRVILENKKDSKQIFLLQIHLVLLEVLPCKQ